LSFGGKWILSFLSEKNPFTDKNSQNLTKNWTHDLFLNFRTHPHLQNG